MAEADNAVGTDRRPADWGKGWFTGIWSDAVGKAITGTLTVSLSVPRTASAATKTTVFRGQRVVPIVDGVPSGEFAVLNAVNVPCVEFLTTDDPDIQPVNLQLVVTESWSGITYYRELSGSNTIENPLWLTGDLTSIEQQPNVVLSRIWEVEAAPGNIPPQAAIGDWIAYSPSGVITKRTS
jgi:hypothetical protein